MSIFRKEAPNIATKSKNIGRGGARPGAGRKKKSISDRIAEGQTPSTILEFPTSPVEGANMPAPSSFLSAEQKNGTELHANIVYEQTWTWLKERGVATYVAPKLIEQYAMSVARWEQCEEVISKYGFLSKHPTTGNPIASPYVSMSQQFMNQATRLWNEIYQIVRDQCQTPYQGASPHEDVMERLLRSKS